MTAVRGVIFDLDDTLFDCTGQLTRPARKRAAAVLATGSPDLSESDLVALQTDLSGSHGSAGAIREIGARRNLPTAVVDKALAAYNRDEVPPIDPYPDVHATLRTLSRRTLALSLVTTGRRARQLAKVDRLGLSVYFQPGRNLFVHEPDDDRTEKDAELLDALAVSGVSAAETLSVGDKLDADIRVGNRLGLITVRMRAGRQRDTTPASPEETPDYEIGRIGDLLRIIETRST